MINELNVASTLLSSGQIGKTNQIQPGNKSSNKTEESQESSSEKSRESKYSDVATFSSQALALAKQAVPSSQNSDQQVGSEQKKPASEQYMQSNSLDIRA